jgi:hypothetical protein
MFGFLSAMQLLPMIICKKEDAIGQTDLDLSSITTREDVEKMEEQGKDIMQKIMKNEPQVKMVMGGMILEMVQKGIFEL